jgi:hypothetical protein
MICAGGTVRHAKRCGTRPASGGPCLPPFGPVPTPRGSAWRLLLPRNWGGSFMEEDGPACRPAPAPACRRRGRSIEEAGPSAGKRSGLDRGTDGRSPQRVEYRGRLYVR